MTVRVPRSTYRLQLTPSFTLTDATRWVDYLHRLGADWLYCSPLLQAAAGSDHGYDVVDHSRTDAARGGRPALGALAEAAHGAGMGVLVDIVPNHVGVAHAIESVWWWDVLANGPASRFAVAFDIDWAAGGGKVLLPVLGDGPGELDLLRCERTGGGGVLRYRGDVFPLAPGSAADDGTPRQVHERQHYRLVSARGADTELNYRRFFAVSGLAGIRVEDGDVFAASHREIRHWFDAGWVDGLRVDHPDGLRDPAGYLHDLSGAIGGRYTVVEKILQADEELPADWACAGTTGYETAAAVDRVLVDPSGRDALSELDARLRHGRVAWADVTYGAKRAVADGMLGSEVRRLARLVPNAPSGDRVVDATAELVSSFAVYRTYRGDRGGDLARAVGEASRRRPELAPTVELLGGLARVDGTEFAERLRQTTGAVMAKGVEDCAFYRFPRLASLTEVGGDPSIFSISPAEFHAAQGRRLATWPHGLTTLSTHDTKRGEDVRARIDALSELAEAWAAAVTSWVERLAFPDGTLANLLFQSAVGAWPIEAERLHGYAEKAAREAATCTDWADPDAAFEHRLHVLVDACYEDVVIAPELAAFADRIRPAGWCNSLSAKLIQLTVPGVPDVYRGTELWRNDLVDPDNRRPFDAFAPGGASEMLARIDAGHLPTIDDSGAAKLLVTARALRARRDSPELFRDYRPMTADGPAAEHLLAFDRGGAITLATRLPVGLAARGGWGGTTVTVPPGRWCDAVAGCRVAAGAAPGHPVTLDVAEVMARYPVALLLRV